MNENEAKQYLLCYFKKIFDKVNNSISDDMLLKIEEMLSLIFLEIEAIKKEVKQLRK